MPGAETSVSTMSYQVSWTLNRVIELGHGYEGPRREIACLLEFLATNVPALLPPAQGQHVERPIDDLDKRIVRPYIFLVAVEKYDPSCDNSFSVAVHRVSTCCKMMRGVVVKSPRHLLDGDSSAVSPVNLNVIQIVVTDSSGRIAPKGQRQPITRLFANHCRIQLGSFLPQVFSTKRQRVARRNMIQRRGRGREWLLRTSALLRHDLSTGANKQASP